MLENGVEDVRRLLADRCAEVTGELTYKPNWRISVVERVSAVLVDVEARVDNARAGGETLIGRSEMVSIDLVELPREELRRAVVELVWLIIAELEVHEAQEWFREHGAIIDDPHDYRRDDVTRGQQILSDAWRGKQPSALRSILGSGGSQGRDHA